MIDWEPETNQKDLSFSRLNKGMDVGTIDWHCGIGRWSDLGGRGWTEGYIEFSLIGLSLRFPGKLRIYKDLYKDF